MNILRAFASLIILAAFGVLYYRSAKQNAERLIIEFKRFHKQ